MIAYLLMILPPRVGMAGWPISRLILRNALDGRAQEKHCLKDKFSNSSEAGCCGMGMFVLSSSRMAPGRCF